MVVLNGVGIEIGNRERLVRAISKANQGAWAKSRALPFLSMVDEKSDLHSLT